jgi:hypothetical protein
MDNERNRDDLARPEPAPKPWEPMRLTYLGDAAELLRSSNGELSVPSSDPGDARPLKTRGYG